ncbi:MAG: tetratricopeptide repeat protein, partial [Lachnospiraceae bacterium]|nr:tetratricopeptide repeat protein [Lachnospiraceae bacterium]
MDINTFLSELDNLFASKRFSEVDDFLKDNYDKAVTEQDINAQITILNEMAGYYREATRYKEAVRCVDQSRKIMDELGMQKTMQYATTLINEANAYRAAGLCEHALECYAQVEEIY